MDLDKSYHLLEKSIGEEPAEQPEEDYSVLLKDYNLEYRYEGSYILVGEPKVMQGWLMHLTVIPLEMEKLMNRILPSLTKYGFPFKIIKSKKHHKDLNAGFYGQFKLGKVVTIFLDEESLIESFTERLMVLTGDFVGPQIFTDFNIDNIIYTRYGSFISRVQSDPYGNNIRVIEDVEGNLFLDKYYTPPVVPNGIKNPFLGILQKKPAPSTNRWIGNKYLPMKQLKSDAKGDVWKALYFSKHFWPKWCVVKQGRKGMFPDEFGRDARDRLAWQFEVNKSFRNMIRTPHILEYFQEKGQGYLVMEYIRGSQDLMKVILDKLDRKVWFDQPVAVKLEILDYLLQIVRIVQAMHENEYVHRDITSANFLLGKGKKIFAIDLELAYSMKDDLPEPPFGVGTPGYMSPEQEVGGQLPFYTDDSYSLGALMIMIFTSGIGPHKILSNDNSGLYNKLLFYVRDSLPVSLMVRCVVEQSKNRPDIRSIYNSLSDYKDIIKKGQAVVVKDDSVSISDIREVVKKGICALSGTSLSHENKWFSPVDNEFGEDVYPLKDKHFMGGLYKGVGGIIWFLGEAKSLGFHIEDMEAEIESGIDLIQEQMIARMDTITPGMYYGKAGVAVTLASAIRSGFIDDCPENRDLIRQCFDQPTETQNLLYGLAGIGMAVLSTADLLEKNFLLSELERIAQNLIQTQQKDGSWTNDTVNKKPEVFTGFGYGVAGIVWFLLEYSQVSGNEEALNAAFKGLGYLERNAKWNEGHYEWVNSNRDRNIGHWWCKGGPGIALTFLKAYEVSKDPSHLDYAEKALQFHPRHLVNHKLSQCHGLSGLGEIYLEAYKISHKLEWLERASWIASYLVNYSQEPGSVTWLTEGANFPTGDFMIGNTGILHFLLRYCFPEKIGFPFLSHIHNH